MVAAVIQDLWQLREPTKHLRYLMMGRVLLKTNYAGGLQLPVGIPVEGWSAPLSGPPYPTDGRSGVGMFRGNGIDVHVVQQSDDGLSVEWEEDAEIEPIEDGGWPLNLTLTAPLSHVYTTDCNAYVTIPDLAAAVQGLKLVQHEVKAVAVDSAKVKLPALWVQEREVGCTHLGATEWNFEYTWECKYFLEQSPGEDVTDSFAEAAEQILNQVIEDQFCGGVLDEMDVRAYQRQTLDGGALGPIDVARFSVWGQVERTNPKALRTEG